MLRTLGKLRLQHAEAHNRMRYLSKLLDREPANRQLLDQYQQLSREATDLQRRILAAQYEGA